MGSKNRTFFTLIYCGLSIVTLEAQIRHRDAVVGRLIGALTGASLAEELFGNQCYYQDGPAYDFVYPGAPLYAYDYPTYLYSPIYAYPHMSHAIYPSYFFSR
jgi:hypothetical protein